MTKFNDRHVQHKPGNNRMKHSQFKKQNKKKNRTSFFLESPTKLSNPIISIKIHTRAHSALSIRESQNSE